MWDGVGSARGEAATYQFGRLGGIFGTGEFPIIENRLQLQDILPLNMRAAIPKKSLGRNEESRTTSLPGGGREGESIRGVKIRPEKVKERHKPGVVQKPVSGMNKVTASTKLRPRRMKEEADRELQRKNADTTELVLKSFSYRNSSHSCRHSMAYTYSIGAYPCASAIIPAVIGDTGDSQFTETSSWSHLGDTFAMQIEV